MAQLKEKKLFRLSNPRRDINFAIIWEKHNGFVLEWSISGENKKKNNERKFFEKQFKTTTAAKQYFSRYVQSVKEYWPKPTWLKISEYSCKKCGEPVYIIDKDLFACFSCVPYKSQQYFIRREKWDLIFD